MHSRPRLVLTGASGFLARYVIRAVKEHYRILAVDRNPRGDTWVPPGAEVEWHQVDLGDAERTRDLFDRLAADGGADAVIHLAAYYDFTGEDHPEFWRTNVEGLRHVLEGSRALALRRFVFASSVAACPFPRPGEPITEETPPHGSHLYARTKRIGEEMLAEYRDAFPSVIVRFAALFSDWCEYPPLYHFIGTWLSDRWNASILGGKGRSAIPYLHVRDGALFLRSVLEHQEELEPEEVLTASPDGAVSHLQLFEATLRAYHDGLVRRPLFVPKLLCGPGMWLRDRVGRAIGDRPFERPWMAEYVDDRLVVDASRSRARLGWEPRTRLEILYRMPFLVENFKTDPVEWERRNQQVIEARRLHPNLQIYQLLQDQRQEIEERFATLLAAEEAQERVPHYQELDEEERQWNHRLILRNLIHAVRTRRKGLFMAYCRDLAERRAAQGFHASEVIFAIDTLHRACHEVLIETTGDRDLDEELHDAVMKTIRFGIDQVEMVFEALQGRTLELPADIAEKQRLVSPTIERGAREYL